MRHANLRIKWHKGTPAGVTAEAEVPAHVTRLHFRIFPILGAIPPRFFLLRLRLRLLLKLPFPAYKERQA